VSLDVRPSEGSVGTEFAEEAGLLPAFPPVTRIAAGACEYPTALTRALLPTTCPPKHILVSNAKMIRFQKDSKKKFWARRESLGKTTLTTKKNYKKN
jgi:hypothetical protein